jgi:hypothetical protein
MASLKSQGGLEEVPQVALGYAHAVTSPVNLAHFECKRTESARIKPYDPGFAWEVVRIFLGW